MKKRFVLCALLFVSILFVGNSFAQDTVQWDLPEGAKARIGKGRARDIALSPDGTQLAVATGIGVWLYNVGTGAEIALLTGHTDRVNSVAYSPNGDTLASVSGRELLLWNPTTQQQKATFEDEGGGSLAYSPNGKTLAVGRWKEVRVLNARTGALKFALSYPEGEWVDLIAISSNGKTLAGSARFSFDNIKIYVWNIRTGKQLRTISTQAQEIHSLVFSPTANVLTSGYWGVDQIDLWNPGTGKKLITIQEWSESLAYSPNGKKIAVGRGGEISLLNANTGQVQQTLSGHKNGVNSIVFSSDGSTLVSGSWDGTIRLWNASTGSHRLTIEGHFDFRSVTLSPNGKTIATASDDGIFLWNASNGKFTKAFDVGGRSHAVAYSPDGKTLAIETWDDGPQIQLLNANAGRVKKTLRHQGESARSIAFSPDGKMLASGSQDGTIHLWNARTGKLQKTLTKHTVEITSLVFSPDSKVLASGSWDGTVNLWNAGTGKPQKTISLEGRPSVAFSPDGKVLASGSWREIRLLNAQNGQVKQIIDGRGEALAFTKDGKTLASGGWRRIQLWNARTGEPQRSLTGPPESVAWLAFDPKGNTLVSRGWDGTIFLWDMNALPELIAEDVNLDGIVDVEDLVTVALSFGKSVTKGTYPNPDLNSDGVVNRQDVLRVMTMLEAAAGAPSIASQVPSVSLQYWINRAKQLNNTDADFQNGIQVLEELLATLMADTQATPAETALLANYPNPFNPETWIPYQLSKSAEVRVSIHSMDGRLVRTLELGQLPAGVYAGKNRAAYWDGRNAQGESVASGVYFYTLTAGDFSATRKMLILK